MVLVATVRLADTDCSNVDLDEMSLSEGQTEESEVITVSVRLPLWLWRRLFVAAIACWVDNVLGRGFHRLSILRLLRMAVARCWGVSTTLMHHWIALWRRLLWLLLLWRAFVVAVAAAVVDLGESSIVVVVEEALAAPVVVVVLVGAFVA